MYFLLRINPAVHHEQLIPGETFYFRPAPGQPLFGSAWRAMVGKPTGWRYVSIPEDELPTPSDQLVIAVEDGICLIDGREYRVLPITLRRFLMYCCEAAVYLTVDESWWNPNWRLWRKTGGKGR